MKRNKLIGFVFVLLSLGTVLAMVAGCGSNTAKVETKPTPTQQREVSFLDQNDHKVVIKAPVNRIVCLQHHSLDILTMLGAQDKVVGVVKDWNGLLGGYMKDVFPGIEKLPTPGTLENANVEEIAKLKPDLVIVAAQFKADQVKQLEALGIPVMTVTLRGEGKQAEAQNPVLANADAAYTRGCEWAVKKLGEVTGKEERAAKLWDFAMADRKYIEEHLNTVPPEKKIRVFVANEGNITYGSDKYVGCQLERAGAVNVAAKEIKGVREVSVEQVAKWDPDVVIVQDRYKSTYDLILSQEPWKAVRAVRQGRVILAPYWTKPWGNPGPDSIALGELWLANQFYPDQIPKDVVAAKAKAFYQEFYGIPFAGTL